MKKLTFIEQIEQNRKDVLSGKYKLSEKEKAANVLAYYKNASEHFRESNKKLRQRIKELERSKDETEIETKEFDKNAKPLSEVFAEITKDIPQRDRTMNKNEWIASNYLDTDQCGILNFNNEIIAGVSFGLSRDHCERIVDEHNRTLDNSLKTLGVNDEL